MARRVRAFVDLHGRRPLLSDIEGDDTWRECHETMQQLRVRFGKVRRCVVLGSRFLMKFTGYPGRMFL